MFTYSERANTKALEIKPVVGMRDRNERSKMLHILSDKKRRAFYEDNLGKEFPVLFEEGEGGDIMHGFTSNYVKVVAKYDPLRINDIVKVRLRAINEEMEVEVDEVPEEILSH